MKIFIQTFLFLILSLSIFANDTDDSFKEAKILYEQGFYADALIIFETIYQSDNFDTHLKGSSLFYLSECLMLSHNYEGAIARFEELVNNYTYTNFRDKSLYYLGILYFKKGNYFQSRNYLRVIQYEYPESEYLGTTYYWIGISFLAEDKLDEAEEYLRESISYRNKNFYIKESIYSLGNVFEKLGKYDEAAANYDEFLTYYHSSELAPLAVLRLGVSYFNLKEYDRVILELTDPKTEKLPDSLKLESKYLIANSFFSLKEYDNALKELNKILNENPDELQNTKTIYNLAWIYFQQKDYIEAYNKFISLVDSPIDSLAKKSLFYAAESKRYLYDNEASLNLLSKFTEKYPNDDLLPQISFTIGLIKYNSANYPEAESNFLEALKSIDYNIKGKALNILGDLNLNRNQLDRSLEYYEEALKIKKLNRTTYKRIQLGAAITLYNLGNEEDAIKYLKELVSDKNFETDKVNYYLGECYFKKNDYINSIRHYSRVSGGTVALKSAALYGRAYSFFNLKDFPNSAFYFHEFISNYPNSELYNDAKLRLADSYYGTKNFDKASEIYNDIFASDNYDQKSDFGLYQYGQALFKSGKPSQAISKFTELQNNFPNSKYADDAQYLKGWIQFQNANYEEAITNYRRAIYKYPNSDITPIAYYSIGDSYYNLGNFDQAIEFYKELIEKYPTTNYVFDAFTGIQYSYLAKNEADKASDMIIEFISNYPNLSLSDKILLKKGELYYSAGDYQKAIEGYREFIASYPSSKFVPDAYYWIAKSSFMLNKPEQAVYNYKIVLDNYINTDAGINSSLDIAAILYNSGKMQEALDYLQLVLDANPEQTRVPEILIEKAKFEKMLKQFEKSEETLSNIVTYYDMTIFADKAKIELALLRNEQYRFEESIQLLVEVSDKRNDDIGAMAQFYLGDTYFLQGNIEKAINSLVRVRSVYSGYRDWYARSLLKLGDCYIRLKDYKKAKEMFTAVYKNHKGDEFGKEARKKLGTL